MFVQAIVRCQLRWAVQDSEDAVKQSRPSLIYEESKRL